MNHYLAFFNAGCEGGRGTRMLVVPIRRALRRLLRPFFFRLYDILIAIVTRIDGLDDANAHLHKELDCLKAYHWNNEAITRRLAMLEDRIEALTRAIQSEPGTEPHPAIHIPSRASDESPSTRPRSKAG